MGVKWGLYEHLRYTADAMRTFLSRITPSRAVFRAILVPRDLWDSSEMIVRAWSLVTRLLTPTDFLTPNATCDPWKWTNTVSETGIEPSRVGIGQKLISVDRKVYTIHVDDIAHFVTWDFRDFSKTDTWIYCKADCDEFHSNGLSVELSVKWSIWAYLDRM